MALDSVRRTPAPCGPFAAPATGEVLERLQFLTLFVAIKLVANSRGLTPQQQVKLWRPFRYET